MGMVVKNNMSAVRTLNTLNSNTSALQKSLAKVSSGMKINSAQDDASGYAISERMRVRIRSLDQANQNTQNDSSLMKTAEGAVGNTVEILRALKEKAINAANDSNTDEDRQTIQKEINQFIDQIDDNALVQFNGKYLVDGSKNNAFYQTKSILLNQSLHTTTLAASALTDLSNRAGDSLGIQETDQYQVSWVQNGTVNFTSGTVGDNTISNILTLSVKGKDDSGNETDVTISEVSATPANGLISGAADAEDVNTTDPYISMEPAFTYSKDDGLAADSDIVKDALTQDATLADGTSGSPASVLINDIQTANGDPKYKYIDSSGEVKDFDAADAITYDGTTYKLPDAYDGLEIVVYNDNYVAPEPTKIKTTETNLTLTDETLGAGDTENNFTSALAKICVDSTLLDITAPANTSSAGTVTETATMKLSDILTKNDNNEDVPKYYLSEDGTVSADDIIVTRSKVFLDNGSGNGTAAYNNSDKIEFSSASGATLSSLKIYEYAGEVETAEEEEGLTDAWDKFGKAVYTPDKTAGVAFGSTAPGVNDQISGLTISILDQDGNVKKAANAALDQFKQYQRAENETGDMSLNFHIGSEANVSFKVGMGDMRSQALGLKGSDGTRIDVFTKEHANAAINVIENALTKALDQQTTIGAIEARLEYTSTNLTTSSENVQAAESTIRDADMAKEMTNYTKSNVLLQAAQAMLAQANQNSSAVLSLLQ